MSKYFAVCLEDYSASPICPGNKTYYGTKQEVADFIKAIENDNKNSEISIGQHTVICIEKTVLILKNHVWEHINTWGFPYMMKADEITIEQILIKVKNKYYRCIKPTFQNLQYSTEDNNWMVVGNRLWGFPNIYEITAAKHRCRLYAIEQVYTCLCEAQQDMNDAKRITFKTACDDIFGDG